MAEDNPHPADPATQRAAQVAVAVSTLILLCCWGLVSVAASLAIYAAGWVAAVGAASSAALLYRLWTAGRPDLQDRTQTMTLGLVGWLIVIGVGMTLFRAASSVFIEAELGAIDFAAWLLPVPLLGSAGLWLYLHLARREPTRSALGAHAMQHMVTAAALALAEAGLIVAMLGDDVQRWPDVLAAVAVIGVGGVWSWVRLWRRYSRERPVVSHEGAIDPELSANARAVLDTARGNATIHDYDRLAIEPSPAGARLTVRLHLGGDQPLRNARDTARQIERSLEALLPAGSVDVLIETASTPIAARAEAPPSAPADRSPADPDTPDATTSDDPRPDPHAPPPGPE